MKFFSLKNLGVILFILAAGQSSVSAQDDIRRPVFGEGFGVDVKIERITEAEIEKIAALGIRDVRSGMRWERIEKRDGDYEWDRPLPRDPVADGYSERRSFNYDRSIEQIHRHGLHMTMILGGGNPIYTGSPVKVNWNGEDVFETPAPRSGEAIDAFAAFAAATVRHYSSLYGPQAIDWIIWNEPDLDAFFPPKADGVIAGRIIETACRRIKEAVPEAKVMGPALGTMDGGDFRYGFVKNLFAAANPLTCLDAFTLHPYRPTPPETAVADYARMAAFIAPWQPEKKVPIAVDEWGTPSSRPALDRLLNWKHEDATEEQAALQLRMYLSNLAADIPYTVIYEWRDSGTDPDEPEDNYGLTAFAGEEKPFIRALRYVWLRLSGRTLFDDVKSSSCGKNVHLLRFAAAGEKERDILVAWTSGNASGLKLQGNFGAASTMFGDAVAPEKAGKEVKLPLSGVPLLIYLPQGSKTQVACRRFSFSSAPYNSRVFAAMTSAPN